MTLLRACEWLFPRTKPGSWARRTVQRAWNRAKRRQCVKEHERMVGQMYNEQMICLGVAIVADLYGDEEKAERCRRDAAEWERGREAYEKAHRRGTDEPLRHRHEEPVVSKKGAGIDTRGTGEGAGG